MSFSWTCHVCPPGSFSLTWTTELAAQASAVWHVYLEHRDVWQSLVGSERPPQDAKPETLGQLLEW